MPWKCHPVCSLDGLQLPWKHSLIQSLAMDRWEEWTCQVVLYQSSVLTISGIERGSCGLKVVSYSTNHLFDKWGSHGHLDFQLGRLSAVWAEGNYLWRRSVKLAYVAPWWTVSRLVEEQTRQAKTLSLPSEHPSQKCPVRATHNTARLWWTC